MSWPPILMMIVGAYGFKALGMFGLARNGSGALARRLDPFTALIPAALFTALIVVQTFGDGRSLSLDAKVVGVAAAALAVSRRAPFVVVVGVAMAVTAAVRAVAG